MARVVVLRGQVIGPTTVKLESPAPPEAKQAEVLLHVPDSEPTEKLSEILRRLPAGTGSAAGIQRQIENERRAWDEERWDLRGRVAASR